MAASGKSWEHEVGAALRSSCAWRYNTNDHNPVCDWLASYAGPIVLLECKETHNDLLSFSAVSDRERQSLWAVHCSGGFAAVIIKRCFYNSGRVWVVVWDQFQNLMENSGRKSISLRDGERPACLIELAKKERPNGLGRVWDLDQVLEPWLLSHCWRLISRFQQAKMLNVTGPQRTQFPPLDLPRPASVDAGKTPRKQPEVDHAKARAQTAMVLNLFKPLEK